MNEYKERFGIQPPPGVADEDASWRGTVIDDKDPVRLSAELHQREAMIRLLEHRVKELEQSTSWRITKPLRSLKRLLGKDFRP